MERKITWENYDADQLKKMEEINREYRDFLDHGKTERECIDTIVNIIEAEGYRELEKLIEEGARIRKGDKVYSVCMNKSIVMFQMGDKPLTEGMNILGAHIDSPRLDVKQNPFYEDSGFAYLDTHYYGGVKKYQWVALPLAIHGVVVKKDGTTVELNVGENEDDPVFFVSDLLIHLAGEQLEKKASKVIEGEALDLIVGSRPIVIKADEKEKEGDEQKDKAKEAVKAGVLDILKETYDIEEEDFLSAELEIVPAGKAREAGFDRSMILAYGQDDRVCAYTSMRAMLDIKETDRTVCCILVDKEEIGSVGATGMQSRFFENAVAELMNLSGEYSELNVRRCLAHSCMLSSDVSAGYDPSYASCFEKKNAAYLGKGMVFNKFTGSRGKSGSNDANAEYIAHLRKVLEDRGIMYQTAELGKVDVGGGGTIAYILALYGMNVIDSGVAVLNMHAPWEATSKADVYETYRGYMAFAEGASM
nr:aminopeptidase [uncultured Acetatifactor sp.]